MKSQLAVLMLAILAVATGAAGQILPPVYHEHFDQAQLGAAGGWEPFTWSGKADFIIAEPGAYVGGKCLRIQAQEADAAWTLKLAVAPKSVYKLSGLIRTENVATEKGKGALLNIHNLAHIHTAPLTGTRDWTRVELVFDSGELSEIQVNCLLGGWGAAAGTAWFDEVRLDHLSQANLYPAVRFNGADMGSPISKYIYGQFIEHLGRCIYGGIWAEMLEDRKFYYAVGDKESPWQAIGEGVTMSADGAYVGAHTPVVALAADAPRGIAQDGLALVQGKEYTGRAVLAGDGPAQVTLFWGEGDDQRAVFNVDGIGSTFKKFPFKFTAGGATDNGRLEITAAGSGELKIGTVSLMPADNVEGMRADTLAVLKALNSPVYRWPGGNFVSGYDWKDGIGDPDKRPPRKNPAWKGVEHNDFGADEFMRFVDLLKTEAYVVVNSGTGGVESAVEEVQYFLGGASTPGGKLRAANGHKEPYKVGFIGIGNEMYGDWQLGHMPLADYVKKHNEFAEAIRKEAPKAALIAVGATGPWSETMLRECAGNMEMLSEHFYSQDRPELISYVAQIPDNIRAKVAAHREYHARIPALAGKLVPICMDEWNYWHGPEIYGELGTQYFLRDALGIAAGLNAYYGASDMVYMANYAQTVNVIGCVKTSKTAACLDTTGVVLALYRREYGTHPIAYSGNPFPLDVSAAWTADQGALTLSIVNPTHEPYDLAVGVDNMSFPSGGKRWVVTGAESIAKNVPGEAPGVTVTEETVAEDLRSFPAPPLSATLYRLSAHPQESPPPVEEF